MKVFLLNLAILFCGSAKCQDIPTADLFKRIYQLKFDTITGTTFLLDHEEKNYLITARHILKGAKDKQILQLEIYQDSTWKSAIGQVFLHNNSTVDVAVIKPLEISYVDSPIKISSDNAVLGDEGYFLGFPFGFRTSASGMNDGFPFPLIKKAVFSGRATRI